MSTVEKFLVAVTGLALVTTLILPKRQTPQVISAAAKGVSGVIGTAMGATRIAK